MSEYIDIPYRFAIIGFGIAGQILTLELLQNSISPNDICIFDETFLGGALCTEYGSVLSNTPWYKIKKALMNYTEWNTEAINEGDTLYKDNECIPVRDISRLCLKIANTASKSVNKQLASITEVEWINEPQRLWNIHHTFGITRCKTLFLTQGSIPKMLDVSKPCIPLSIALDKEQLRHHVDPKKDIITVFGTAHSGTLILKNLHDLGVCTKAIHKTSTPFIFAKDGEHDGLKEGTELIAQAILRNEYLNLTLVPWTDPLIIHKILLKTTKCIVSIGFQKKMIKGMPTTYDSSTGALDATKQVYGFGIAYPSITVQDGRTYTKVSLASFQEQIQKCLPLILKSEY
jgi:hypothetical protein